MRIKFLKLWRFLAEVYLKLRQIWTISSPPPEKCKISPESTEWFMEDKAFSSSYNLAPPPPLPFSRQWARRATHKKTEKERQCAGGSGRGGDGGGTKSKDRKNVWSSINHALLYAFHALGGINISQGKNDISFTSSAFHYCVKTVILCTLYNYEIHIKRLVMLYA